jgi:hypothetical protein
MDNFVRPDAGAIPATSTKLSECLKDVSKWPEYINSEIATAKNIKEFMPVLYYWGGYKALKPTSAYASTEAVLKQLTIAAVEYEESKNLIMYKIPKDTKVEI